MCAQKQARVGKELSGVEEISVRVRAWRRSLLEEHVFTSHGDRPHGQRDVELLALVVLGSLRRSKAKWPQ